jgi:hypothetical protein
LDDTVRRNWESRVAVQPSVIKARFSKWALEVKNRRRTGAAARAAGAAVTTTTTTTSSSAVEDEQLADVHDDDQDADDVELLGAAILE